MKKVVLVSVFLVLAAVSVSCKAKKGDSKMKTDYIRNGIAFDCPDTVKLEQPKVKLGEVKHVMYHSTTCGRDRGMSILFPASYDGTKKFPVVYFQHGIFGDEYCMINDEKNAFRQVTANLAAQKEAKEFIMVFGHMYASTDPNQKPSFKQEDVLPYDNYINELINDIMPYIESNYAVLTGRENTAICGFSMGGRESLYIGLNRSDLFGYIGAIAPAPGLVPSKDWAMSHPGMMQESELHFKEGNPLPEFLMVCCGTQDSVVGQFPKTYHRILETNKVEHTWFEVLNADHNDLAIRSGFCYFAMNIFQK